MRGSPPPSASGIPSCSPESCRDTIAAGPEAISSKLHEMSPSGPRSTAWRLGGTPGDGLRRVGDSRTAVGSLLTGIASFADKD